MNAFSPSFSLQNTFDSALAWGAVVNYVYSTPNTTNSSNTNAMRALVTRSQQMLLGLGFADAGIRVTGVLDDPTNAAMKFLHGANWFTEKYWVGILQKMSKEVTLKVSYAGRALSGENFCKPGWRREGEACVAGPGQKEKSNVGALMPWILGGAAAVFFISRK